jgi:hypothetical protein
MSNHTAVKLIQPGTFSGQLAAILRNSGACPARNATLGEMQ